MFLFRNGFSSGTESISYGGVGQQTHLQTQQQDSVQSQSQPSPRSVNSQVSQENQQQQTNGGSVPNQQTQSQQVKQTAPSTTTSTTTEGQRPEGSKWIKNPFQFEILKKKLTHLVASYAGIAKMNPSVGSTSNVNTNTNVNSTSTAVPRGSAPTVPGVAPTTSQQPNAVRTSVKTPLTTNNRPNSNSQSGQQRPGNNYYPQNNRGKVLNEQYFLSL